MQLKSCLVLFTILLTATFSPPVLPQTNALALSFGLYFWKRPLNQLPQRIPVEITANLTISPPVSPGQATLVKLPFSTLTEDGLEIEGELQLAWTYPAPDTKLPPYFNLQVTVEKPFRALCAMTPKVDNEALPSLICAQAPAEDELDEQLGVTVVDRRLVNKP